MSTKCLWVRGDDLVSINVTRTQGDDIPAGHYEAEVMPTGTTEFVPVAEIVSHHCSDADIENIKRRRENS